MNGTQWLFCGVTVFYWFSMYTYVPILPLYAASLGASYSLVGLVIGVYGITQLILRVPQGVLSDRWHRRRLFVIMALGISAISALGMWLVPNIYALLFFRSLSGVAATAWVIFVVLFASYFSVSESPKAYGIMNSLGFIGQMVGMFAGGLISEWMGWSATFALAALGGVAGFALSFAVPENVTLGKAPLQIAEIPGIISDASLLTAAGMAILVQLVVYGTMFGFVPVAARNLGASNFELGLLTTLTVVPAIAASFFAGTWFLRTIGRKQSLILGFAFLGISAAAVPFLTNLYELYLLQMIGGFGRGLLFPLLMVLSVQSIDDSRKATGMGVFQSLYAAGMFIGPVVVGLVSDSFSLREGFLMCGLFGLIGAVMAYSCVDRKKEPSLG